MKKRLTLAILLLLTCFSAFAQEEIQYKEYSYTEFFQLIEDEEDSVFQLSNATVLFKPEQDSSRFGYGFNTPGTSFSLRTDTITINKSIVLNNVNFMSSIWRRNNRVRGYAQLGYIKFTKPVSLTNTNASFSDNSFEGRVSIYFTSDLRLDKGETEGINLIFEKNNFNDGLNLTQEGASEGPFDDISFESNTFNRTDGTFKGPFNLLITIEDVQYFTFTNNVIGKWGLTVIRVEKSEDYSLDKNHFKNLVRLNTPVSTKVLSLSQNQFDNSTALTLGSLLPTYTITWPQLENKLFSLDFLGRKMQELQIDPSASYKPIDPGMNNENIAYYLDSLKIQDEFINKEESKIRGRFYDFYKAQHDIPYANRVYIELKDLETARLAYLYQQNPSFDTFFKWKINQFLRTFSAYGTEPAKAITFSVYVILVFALVYLFFPNHWDSHGKNRIKDRFMFFHKYLRLNKGIQDVYLEGQSAEIESSHAFRKVLDDHRDDVPPFFYNAAKPLLKWSTASIILSSSLLSRLDFLKGSWKDTAPKVRGFRTALTILIFIIALCYDILIKMLNALMLSINTFTTLGFGEIPIKGLPRYLAIIQGFIGWFMLTIFSVSLISQLLN